MAAAEDVLVKTENVRNTKCLVIENDRVRLALDAAKFTLTDLVDRSSGEDFVVEPGHPLFKVSFEEKSENWFTTSRNGSIDGTGATHRYFTVKNSDHGKILELHYDGNPLTVEGNKADVIVSIDLGSDDSVFRWGLQVRTKSEIGTGEVLFPTLSGLGSSLPGSEKRDYLVTPGSMTKPALSPRSKAGCGQGFTECPSPGSAIQMLVYCDGLGKDSLYMSVLDPKAYRKTLCASPMLSKKSFSWYLIHYPDGEGRQNSWTLPYKVEFGPIKGDWYDAAKTYRKWALSQGRWKLLSSRTDIPKWFKDLSVWYQGQDRNPHEELMAKHVDRLLKIRERLGEDYGFHWYLWQKDTRHDYRYPDYFPAQPGFKEAIAKVQAAGVHAMPYINVQIFDTMADIWASEHAEPWASRDVNGNMYRIAWEPDRKLVNMCPATKYWQDKIVDSYVKLVKDFGVDAIYLDELHVYPYLCYASNHQHSTIGGTHFVDGYRTIISRIRKECGRPDIVITGEGCSENYADLQNAQLIAHTDNDPDAIPFFQTAMKDSTVEMGLTMSRDECRDLDCFAARTGFAFVRGRQLGWFNFDQTDLLDPEYDHQFEFLKKTAQCRRAAQKFLYDGEFLREPDLSLSSTHKVRWYHDKPAMIRHDVLGGAYKATDGDFGIVLVNITGKPVTVSIPVNAKDWGIRPGDVRNRSEYRNGSWSKDSRDIVGHSIETSVPAFSPVVIKFSKVQ